MLSKFRAGLAGLGDADDGATSELAKRAASDLGEKVAQARASELLAETASRVATNDVLHFKYVGACERDLRGCPSDAPPLQNLAFLSRNNLDPRSS